MKVLAVLAALVVAGCQASPLGGDRLAGSWAFDDGAYVTSFRNGTFATRRTDNGETIVEDGRYARAADGIALSWTSLAANEARSATCRFVSAATLTCTPSVGVPFTMQRVVA